MKKLTGTDRADRAVPATQSAGGAMIVPLHLSDLAQLLFGQIAEMLEQEQRSNPRYAQHVALLAQRLEQIQRWQSVLEMEGDTYEAPTAKGVLIRARPEVAMLSDAMRQAQSLIGELMLNPSAALRIASDKPSEPGGFDDL